MPTPASKLLFVALAFTFVLTTACSKYNSAKVMMADAKSEEYGYDSMDFGGEADPQDNTMSMPAKNSEAESVPQMERKIIYTAHISIVVENFDGVETKIKQLVKKFGGYVANANIGRMQGERRHGTWTVRVPVEKFEEMLDSAGDIGIPTSRSQNSQDITEEFVDVQARIANKKKLEAQFLKLLERPNDKIQHVIEVERELARVREDIERMEGRLRYLSNRVDLTTVTISVTEEKEYTPPQAPGFSNRISRAWTSSLENTREFFEDATVRLVGNLLPIAFWLVVLIIGIFFGRRYLKKRREALNS